MYTLPEPEPGALSDGGRRRRASSQPDMTIEAAEPMLLELGVEPAGDQGDDIGVAQFALGADFGDVFRFSQQRVHGNASHMDAVSRDAVAHQHLRRQLVARASGHPQKPQRCRP